MKLKNLISQQTNTMNYSVKLTLSWLVLTSAAVFSASGQPNVIIVMTDDQGYGDIGAHGHPFLKTPNMDKLYSESVRFTDFHVAPMCSPTRGQLMTGVDAMKNGCTAVCQGRSLVRIEIPMLPNYFADAGYSTGIFGKWHLGDSYPYRPQDRGFQEVLSFRAWGLPSLASNWKNQDSPEGSDSYTNPTLDHNGVETQYPGFAGDIWFNEAMKYMAECQKKNKPFFIYLPDNLAHVPDFVPEKYSKPYSDIGTWKGIDGKDVKVPAKYYGQIANIDENMGRLDEFLVKSGLKNNTILIFTSDNGSRSQEATMIWNAGMRGHKTELIEGGHRVHCFFRWPQSGIKHGRDVNELTEVQDIAPTLLELCGIIPANRYPMDGVSWGGLLRNEAWPYANRQITVQYMTSCTPWKFALAASEKWRLIKEEKDLSLYDVANDPFQKKDVAAQNQKVVKVLSSFYDEWHQMAFAEFQKPRYIQIGHTGVPEVILYSNDWQGDYCDNSDNQIEGKAKGGWDIDVLSAGDYHVELSRWPFESGKSLTEGRLKGSLNGPGALPVAKVQLIVADFNQAVDTKQGDKSATFTLNLKVGKTKLTGNLLDKDGKIICGAMYVRVSLVEPTKISAIAEKPMWERDWDLTWSGDPGRPKDMLVNDFWFLVDEAEQTYHAFYLQSPNRGTDRNPWVGHAVSKDLWKWRTVKDALTPELGTFNNKSIVTGSAVKGDDGKWYMWVTALGTRENNLVMAVSDDLIHWTKKEETKIRSGVGGKRFSATWKGQNYEGYIIADPYIHPEKIDGFYWMHANSHMVNAPVKGKSGGVLLFKSKDLREWTADRWMSYTGQFERSETTQTWEHNGKWYLYTGGINGEGRRINYILLADSFYGPYEMMPWSEIKLPDNKRFYIGKVVKAFDGKEYFLAGEGFEGLSDPYPVCYADDGRMFLTMP